MGRVHAEITVKNAADVVLARVGQIAENDVHTVTLTAIVDTGATTLVINEDIFNQLGLSEVETRDINIAGGGKIKCKITDPVNIHWKNRYASVNAVVMPAGEPLLGAPKQAPRSGVDNKSSHGVAQNKSHQDEKRRSVFRPSSAPGEEGKKISDTKFAILGAIPLEFMDLIIDPVHHELVGANGDEVVLMAY